MSAGNFEAKKWGYRQTQEGIVISFLCHPNDVSPEIACAPLGTHYMVAFAKIGDDGQPEIITPKPKERDRTEERKQNAAQLEEIRRATASQAEETKRHKRAWDQLMPTEQAGIRCQEPEFVEFLANKLHFLAAAYDDAADFVRTYCEVDSRSELNTNSKAGAKWKALDAQFLEWQTTARYEASRTR
jgi:hypothetical protein